MARAATTADVFNAIAEPRRRELIDALAAEQPLAVGDLVLALGLPQPAISKHLAVLREVGIVTATRRGRQRMYELNPEQLRPLHDWVKPYERFWDTHLARIKDRAERKSKTRSPSPADSTRRHEKEP
jgi:DNA-binding transcriptional ArsR family regulator